MDINKTFAMARTQIPTRTGPPADLPAFQRDVLGVIAQMERARDRPPKGLAIKEVLGAYYGEEINQGRLYPNLDTLVSLGLVAKDARDGRTNEYRVTGRGRRELAEYREWLGTALEGDSDE